MKRNDLQLELSMATLSRLNAELSDILNLDASEQLSTLARRLTLPEPIARVTERLAESYRLRIKKGSADAKEISQRVTGAVTSQTLLTFSPILELLTLWVWLSDPVSPVGSTILERVRSDNSLSKKDVEKFLEGRFSSVISQSMKGDRLRGRPADPLTDHRKIQLLATYNRYLIVIRSARSDAKTWHRRLDGRVVSTEKVITEKVGEAYSIPDELRDDILRPLSVKEVAYKWLAWSTVGHGTKPTTSYFDKAIKQARSSLRSNGKTDGSLVDAVYTLDNFYIDFTCDPKDKAKQKTLKFTSPIAALLATLIEK